AINTNDTFFGIIYMVIFGLGTIPIMATIPLLGNVIGRNIRKRFGKVLPIFIVILGILFVLRGLSLGIPFISPPAKMLVPHEKMMVPATEKKNTLKMGCCGG
ncbi:MAG: sulfite exporter TauE/SafE family protein, partial [Bacteroidetes bacterium]|nr:sulfite exporter TauE/SafE family protein [Bacteroidota bacterium]